MLTHNFGNLDESASFSDNFTVSEPTDLYELTLSGDGRLNFSLSEFETAIDWTLRDDAGVELADGSLDSGATTPVEIADLVAGTYELQLSGDGETSYDITLTPEYDPLTGVEIDGGYFTVQDETLTVDFLLDGGKYEGQVGLFSLEGLDDLEPGSPEWIREVADRVLSSSSLGHLVIDDRSEAARLNPEFDWEGDEVQNLGSDAGRREFAMTPGDRVGLMLVPNGTIAEVATNPELGGSKRPLFSLSTANPSEMFHVGQLAAADGDVYIIEDERVDAPSDKDYNDVGLRIQGVTPNGVVSVEDVVDDDYQDWHDNIDFQTAPQIVSATLAKDSLNADETLSLDLELTDAEGLEDIASVSLTAIANDGSVVQTATLTEFDWEDTEGENGSLTWENSLSDLSGGDYQLEIQAEDSTGERSAIATVAFTVAELPIDDGGDPPENQAPQWESLDLSATEVNVDDTLSVSGQVSDSDGASDIASVKAIVTNAAGEVMAEQTASDLTATGGDLADFSLDFDLFDLSESEFAPGDYQIEAIVTDQSGLESRTSTTVTVSNVNDDGGGGDDDEEDKGGGETDPDDNNAPEDLRFSILPVYTTGEVLNFAGARVSDPDGADDLARVDFWFEDREGQRIEIVEGDVTEFATDSQGRARFDFEYDLATLAPGRYSLKAIAYDDSNAASDFEVASFSLLSNSGTEDLSDPVRLAIGTTTDLNNYTNPELEDTDNWIVWLTPGTDATALAERVGASNLGESGFIPNTYIWDFNDELSATEITSAISGTPTLELAYPDVPIPLRLLNHKPDYLEEHQWSLHQPIDPTDPNSTVMGVWTHPTFKNTDNQWLSGDGVVIGVIDDGLKYDHIEFNPEAGGRYRPDLSWDYTDRDNDPYPKSIKTETVSLDIEDFSQDSFSFDLPVTLTGVVLDVDISFENTDLNPGELDALENIAIELVSPEKTIEGLGDWISLRNYFWFFLGWNDLQFAASDLIEANEDGEFSLSLDDGFDRSFSGGNWQLQFYNGTYGPIQENWKSVVEKLGSFTMEITTLHPHGTAVTGVVADEDRDIGTRGVAPNADISALRLIGNIDAFDMTYDAYGKDVADALYNNDRNSEIDIFNSSWSSLPFQHQVLAPFALERGAKYGLNGLGNSYIFSAGNDRSRDFGGGLGYAQVNNYSLTKSRHAIAVGAVTFKEENGFQEIVRAPYSNPGVFISAFSNNGAIGNANGTDILTTGVNVNHHQQDTYLGYPTNRSGFGGTSAAAPFVSGVVALMREANPSLTNRDIQHILAESSYKVDPDHQPEELDPDYERPQSGWTTNGAGYDINYQYGFGAVNPKAAVELAADWTSVTPEVRVETNFQNVNDSLPNGGSTGLSDSVRVESDLKLEWVEVVTDIDHDDWNDLTVILTSPDGTDSVLRHSVPDLDTSDVRIPPLTPKDTLDTGRWTFTTPRFWGESSEGEWTLQVLDEKGNEIEGDWNAWKLNLYGTEPQSTVSLEVLDAEAHEDGDAAVFAVTREDNLDEAVVVNYEIGGTANPDNDYQPLTGSVILEPGEKGATISVVPNYDLLSEGEETVEITVTDGSRYELSNETQGTATISDSTTISRYGSFIYENPATGNLYILTEPDTWYGAQAQAEAVGGDLVTINDRAEQDWLSDTFGTRYLFWGGLTDNEIYNPDGEGQFKWVSGDPSSYRDWPFPEPNNSSAISEAGEDSLEVNYAGSGLWNDRIGTRVQPGVIEVDPTQLDNPIVTMMVTDAEAGEDGNAGQIVIQRFDDLSQDLTLDLTVSGTATPGSDYEALPNQVTIPAGEKLVTVPIHALADDVLEERESVVVELAESGEYAIAPLGIVQAEIEDQNPINRIANEVIGRDVQVLDYWMERWQSGESLGELRRAIIREAKDRWGRYETDYEIEKMYQSLFSRSATSDEIATLRDRLGAGETLSQVRQSLEGADFIDALNYVYTNPETGNRYTIGQSDTWLGAQEQAEALGGHLVAINSEAENQWLVDTFSIPRYWMGLQDSPVYDRTEGNFQWVNGESLTYDNRVGYDNVQYIQEGEDFFEFNFMSSRGAGLWNDLPSDLKTVNTDWTNPHGIIEIPASNRITPIALEALDTEASEDGDAAVFAVTREDNLNEALVVNYRVGGTANPNNDYQTLTGSVTIEAGQKAATISVVPNYDLLSDDGETVEITLTPGDEYTFDGATQGAATITDSSTIARYGSFIYENPDTGNLYIVTEPDTWYGAQAQAEAFGGNLVTINNQAEQDWLIETFGDNEILGIGFTNNPIYGGSNGDFNWVNGETVTYTNWEPTEPSNTLGKEDVVNMNWEVRDFPGEGKWNDLPGSDTFYSIAEINPSQLDNPIVMMMMTDAEAGEDGNAGQVVIQRFDDLSQDLTLDLTVSGTATPGSDYEALPNQVTIPAGETLVTVPIQAIFDGEIEDPETAIISIQENDYTLAPQAIGQVIINDSTTPFVPEIYTNPATGSRYLLSQSDTWLGAQEQAEALGGHLVTFENEAENQWVIDTFGDINPWIGFTDSPIYGAREDEFVWASQDAVSFINWVAGEPNNVQHEIPPVFFEGEDFTHLNDTGPWNDLLHDPEWLDWNQRPGVIEISD